MMGLTPDDIAASLEELRASKPLVHALTNAVAAPLTANALLAVGASVMMAQDPAEVPAATTRADALLANIGMATPQKRLALEAAAAAAQGRTPWVLDPVGAGGGAQTPRAIFAAVLARLGPAVIRGNASEILTLADESSSARGVEAADPVSPAAARALSRKTGAVVAQTGARDLIDDGEHAYYLRAGDKMMARISGLGCTLSAIIAAFLGAGAAPLAAATAGCAIVGLAAERAAQEARGPGGLMVGIVDELFLIAPEDLARGLKLESV